MTHIPVAFSSTLGSASPLGTRWVGGGGTHTGLSPAGQECLAELAARVGWGEGGEACVHLTALRGAAARPSETAQPARQESACAWRTHRPPGHPCNRMPTHLPGSKTSGSARVPGAWLFLTFRQPLRHLQETGQSPRGQRFLGRGTPFTPLLVQAASTGQLPIWTWLCLGTPVIRPASCAGRLVLVPASVGLSPGQRVQPQRTFGHLGGVFVSLRPNCRRSCFDLPPNCMASEHRSPPRWGCRKGGPMHPELK